MRKISDAGIRRIATKTAQQGFDLSLWVDDMFREIVLRAGSEVPDGDREEAYNDLSEMLRVG